MPASELSRWTCVGTGLALVGRTVLSIWEDNTCRATVRLSAADVAELSSVRPAQHTRSGMMTGCAPRVPEPTGYPRAQCGKVVRGVVTV